MKTIRVTAQRKAHETICPPVVLAFYLTIGRVKWYEVVMSLPAIVGIVIGGLR